MLMQVGYMIAEYLVRCCALMSGRLAGAVVCGDSTFLELLAWAAVHGRILSSLQAVSQLQRYSDPCILARTFTQITEYSLEIFLSRDCTLQVTEMTTLLTVT